MRDNKELERIANILMDRMQGMLSVNPDDFTVPKDEFSLAIDEFKLNRHEAAMIVQTLYLWQNPSKTPQDFHQLLINKGKSRGVHIDIKTLDT